MFDGYVLSYFRKFGREMLGDEGSSNLTSLTSSYSSKSHTICVMKGLGSESVRKTFREAILWFKAIEYSNVLIVRGTK
jgi:hypothetical protein